MTPIGNWLMDLIPAGITAIAVACGVLAAGFGWPLVIDRLFKGSLSRMKELGIDTKGIEIFLRCWGAVGLGVIVAGAAFGFLPIAICLVVVLAGAPSWYINYRIKSDTRALRDQLIGACVGLANAARAGLDLPGALTSIANDVPEPLGPQFLEIVNGYELRIPFDECITSAKNRIRLDSFTLFANVVNVAYRQGGDIVHALERISQSLQENQKVDLKIESDTRAARTAVNFMSVFPLVFLGLLWLIDRENTERLFSTLSGQLVLGVAFLGVILVRRWCEKIVDIDV